MNVFIDLLVKNNFSWQYSHTTAPFTRKVRQFTKKENQLQNKLTRIEITHFIHLIL